MTRRGLIGSDPLALTAIQEGMIPAPLRDGAAEGESQLDVPQRAAIIGEPVPIVFARRVGDYGGVLINPPATEARFSNDASNAVTASYHLVLSEGRIGSIQVRDVFQRSCRVGTHSQTYNRRAGTWTPGNFITAQPGYTMPQCPYYCGNVGVYTGMSTLSFTVTIPNGSDLWNRQVHAFIRNGMEVTRLVDSATGSSNNYADLAYWAFRNCSKLRNTMIDTTALTAAANFLDVNNFTCDIYIRDSSNLGDFLAELSPYFLLTETRNDGKRGLRPLLPLNANHTIKTTAIQWEFLFNEDYILPGSFEFSMIPPADRKPFAVQAIWRQQLTDDFGIIRTSEVRYPGEAEEGPYEQHDLSAFCTRETHAVKVAAYIRARRKWITHTARWVTRAEDFNTTLVPGDICRVKLARVVSGSSPSNHDCLYQVDAITKTLEGDLAIEATHFPVDSQNRSLVALDVVNTTGSGIILTSNKTGVGCDVNSSSDTSVPAETFTAGVALDNEAPLPTPPSLPPDGAPPSGDGNGPDSSPANPSDGLDAENLGEPSRDPQTCVFLFPECEGNLYEVLKAPAGTDDYEPVDLPPGMPPLGLHGALNLSSTLEESDPSSDYALRSVCNQGYSGPLPAPLTPCTPVTPPAAFDRSAYQYFRILMEVEILGANPSTTSTYMTDPLSGGSSQWFNIADWTAITLLVFSPDGVPSGVTNGAGGGAWNLSGAVTRGSSTLSTSDRLFKLRGTRSANGSNVSIGSDYFAAHTSASNFSLIGFCQGVFEFSNDKSIVITRRVDAVNNDERYWQYNPAV